MRLKELNLEQLERAAEFLEKTYSCGWTIDQLIDIITRLENSGLSDLDQQSLGLLRDFLESAKRRSLKPEHIIRISLETEEEWGKKIQEAYDLGYQHGIEHYKAWLVELIAITYKNESFSRIQILSDLVDSAEQKAMDDAQARARAALDTQATLAHRLDSQFWHVG